MAYRDFLLAGVERPDPPTPSASDSRRFGLEVGRLHVHPEAHHGTTELVGVLAGSPFDVVILRYPARHLDWFAELEAALPEHVVLFGEAITASRIGLPTARGHDAARQTMRFVIEQRIGDELVAELVQATFGEHRPHYAANPLLPDFSAPEAYGEWITSLGDNPRARVIVWYGAGRDEPDGFAAVESYETPEGVTVGEMHIFGTRPGQRRLDEGMAGFFQVERTLTELGATACFTMVQAHNLDAATGLLHVGYRPVLVANTVHVVRRR